ncbi:MAG: hypothetical protein FVQ86_10275, partial [candidate division NC10 bacterium]|nr:hypothetical protein [candidate division NC10 bacterium]
MAGWLNKRLGTRWRPGTWALLLGGLSFFLVLYTLVSITLASHSTTTWDFSSQAGYTFDSNKIEVTGGVARLKNAFTVSHDSQADFDTGTYSGTGFTAGPPAGVKLTTPPTGGTYTSPVIDSGTTETTWKTLSHVPDIEQGTAAFPSGAVVGTTGSVAAAPRPLVANLDPGSAGMEVVIGISKTNKAYQNNNAATPGFTLVDLPDADTIGAKNPIARMAAADLDNDLDVDVIQPSNDNKLITSLPVYINPGNTPFVVDTFSEWNATGRVASDLRIANFNNDTYTNTGSVYREGREILDLLVAANTLGQGTAKKPAGGVLWFRNDGTIAPDIPVYGARSIDACKDPGNSKTGPKLVAVGDLDTDGDMDVVAAWPFNNTPSCTYTDGTTRPATTQHLRGYISGGGDPPPWLPAAVDGVSPFGFELNTISGEGDLLIADVNNDGYPDVVYGDGGNNTLKWFQNPCTAALCSNQTDTIATMATTWAATTIDATATGVDSVEVADFDLDGDMDILANGGGLHWYENQSNGATWVKSAQLQATANGVVVGNLNSVTGDRALDIVVDDGGITWWENTILHSNIRFQIRSCDDAACVGETFIGPDGTAGTYYTSTSETLRIPDNRYFQYRAYVFSNNAGMNPNLQSVTIDYERAFYTDNPTIQNNTGVAFTRITDFTETISAAMAGLPLPDQGTIKYQLSIDGIIYYHWNGSGWAVGAADGGGASLPQADDAATIQANIGTFSDPPPVGLGNGAFAPPGFQETLYFKAFFKSDGNQVVELDSLSVKPDFVTVNLTAPLGGETWAVGDTQNITWTYTCEGTPCGNLSLEYSTDSGTSWSPIASGALTSPYPWGIPAAAGTAGNPTARVRITDNDTSVVTDSSGLFTIAGSATQELTITGPAGGTVFTVGDPVTINWTYSGPVGSNVRLDYSLNGGADGYPYVITASTPIGSAGSGSFSWTAPSTATSTQVKIRIQDDLATPTEAFSSNFTIQGTLNFTGSTPGMSIGETHTVGDPTTLTWDSTGNIADVKLEYSTNGFADEVQTVPIISSAVNGSNGGCTVPVGSTGCYPWTFPDVASSTVKVRVSDARAEFVNTVRATPPNSFVLKGALSFEAGDEPLSTSQWAVGTVVTIKWHSTGVGAIPNVKLFFSQSGSFLLDGEEIDPAVTKTNGQNGSCTPPPDVGALKGGCYDWVVLDRISTSAEVRVEHSSDSTVVVDSALFVVKGNLTVTNPVSASIWEVNATQTISWNKTGTIATVNLYYSVDDFATQTLINDLGPVSNGATGGTFSWTVPDAINTNAKIKVVDADSGHPLTEGISAAFTIRGILSITAPTAGEVLTVGGTKTISWEKTGTINTSDLYFSVDNFATQTLITATPVTNTLTGGSFSWTVPDAISTNVKVKVVDADAGHPATEDTSQAFTIKGGLTVTSPTAGQTFTVNDATTITWNTAGSITTVTLAYSLDDFVSETAITPTPIANTGGLAWTVPDNISSNVKIKVVDADAGHPASDAVTGAFTIKGGLALTAPAAGDILTVNQGTTITWTKTGTINTVNLFYSTDDFVSFSTIGSGVTGTSLAWTVPDAISSNVKIRVVDADAGHPASDAFSGVFTIKGGLAVTAPAAGDILTVGSGTTITWTKTGTIATVNLSYSTDDFASSTSIATGVAGTSLAWTVPDAISANVKVKVVDADAGHPATDDTSAAFTIKADLTVSAPTAGQTFTINDSTTIIWTTSGTVATVTLSYSTDDFATSTLITATPIANTGSLGWTVPDALSTNVKVKVVDADAGHPTSEGISAAFNIKGTLAMTAPSAGDVLTVGGSTTITWTKTGTIPTVNLAYSVDDFVTQTAIATAVGGTSFAWTIPDAISTNVKVKVVDADATHPATDDTSAAFTITGGLIVIAPAAGDLFTVGSGTTITWAKTGTITTVNLSYSTDDFATSTSIATGVTGTTLAWTVPDAISANVKVKVVDADATHPATEAISTAFTVKGGLSVTAPTVGQTFTINDATTITWTTSGTVTTVTLSYSTDNFATSTLITATPIANTGSLAWTVPDALSTNVKVKVVDADAGHPTSEGISAAFNIKGTLAVTAPSAGDVLTVGGGTTITWTKTGTIPTVDLAYSVDDFTTQTLIASAVGGTSLAWTVPDAISTNVKVKVVDADATHPATDDTSAAFTIKGGLSVTAPAAGDILTVGSGTTITWTKTGTIATVNLSYSTDDFATSTSIATGVTGTSLAWTVADAISANVKIKVVDADAGHPATEATSAAFTIKGGLTVSAPTLGQTFTINDATTITWTTSGTVGTVTLSYSTDDFATQTLITATPIANTGSLAWTIPDALSTNVKVKVVDADAGHPTSEGISAAFNIKGILALTAPSAGDVLTVNGGTTITWTKTGTIPTVDLFYSVDDFTTQTLIATAVSGTSLSWTVPDAISTNVKVKVVDADGTHPATDATSAAFTIKGGLSVTAPVAGDILTVGSGTTITWTKTGTIATVNLSYSTDNFATSTSIATGVTGTSLAWTVADAVSANVKIKVVDADAGHPATEAISAAFTIKTGLSVTAPSAGQTFTVNDATTITWTTS